MGAAALDSLTRLPDGGFAHPERLWIAVPVVLVLLVAPLVRRRALSTGPLLLRGLLLLTLVAVLLEPQSRSVSKQTGRLIVLADVSPSMGANGIAEVTRLLAGAPEHDLIAVGATARPVQRLEADPRRHTDLAAGLRLAAARTAVDRLVRVVLLSDGRATVPGTEQAARRLRSERVELWAAALPHDPPQPAARVRVAGIEFPPLRARDKPFTVRATLHANRAVSTRAALYIDGKEKSAHAVTLKTGEQTVEFPDIALPPGRHHAQVIVGDAEARDTLLVAGIPRVLFLAGKRRPVLIADALAVQGMEVEVRGAADSGSVDGLDAFDVIVLLPDAPADELEKHSAALAEFVGRRGGGLLAIGGLEGPGIARLHATPTAHLLPLDVPPRTKPKPKTPAPVRKPEPKIEIVEEEIEAYPIAVCLVVDRSGSMQGRKMRQAKAAAAAAAAALTTADRISVVAFGDTVVVPLPSRVAGDASFVLRALQGLRAEGKTSMFAALEAGYAILTKEPAPIRHLVLISDGVPTDDGPWKNTIRKMAKQKITLSAVGIGFDIDTFLLGSFARWGKGKYWLANHPHKVPQVVTQDTQRLVAARNRRGKDAERNKPTAQEKPKTPKQPKPDPEPKVEPTPPVMLRMLADPGAPREMLKGIADKDLPEVAGVEAGKLRFAAWSAVRAGEGGPPLLAYGRVGLGTAAVLAIDPEAPGARALSAHAEFPRLMAQLIRSLVPDGRGEPLLVTHERAGETLWFTVLGEDGLPRTDLPLTVAIDGKSLPVLRRAGRFEVSLPRRDAPARAAWSVGTLARGGTALPPSIDRELTELGADRPALLRLTGSAERLDRDGALSVPSRNVPVRDPAPLPFLLLAAILLPLDAWVRRRASQ